MQTFNVFSRRDFLKEASALGLAGVSIWAGGRENCSQQIQNRPITSAIGDDTAESPGWVSQQARSL